MISMEGRYEGDLRTRATHISSGNAIITDAPVDNYGKGQAFSPTDLVVAALGSCMATVMGIEARKNGVDMDGLQWSVEKHMAAGPRRIARIRLVMDWDNPPADPALVAKLKDIGLNCPVAKSLSAELVQDVIFNF